MAASTASASSRSTPRHAIAGAPAGGGCPPGRCQARIRGAGASACGVSSRSNRWPAAGPAPPVTSSRGPEPEPELAFEAELATPDSERAALGVLRLVIGLEGRVLLLDRAPPPLVLAVPRHGLGQAFLVVVL